MDDKKKKIIILAVLCVIAIFTITRNIRPRPVADEGAGLAGGVLPDISGDPAVLKRTAKRTDFESWERNPFSPKVVVTRKATGLILSGILWDDGNPSAIIDDEIVNIGSRIGSVVVVDITRKSVRLNDGVNDFDLSLED